MRDKISTQPREMGSLSSTEDHFTLHQGTICAQIRRLLESPFEKYFKADSELIEKIKKGNLTYEEFKKFVPLFDKESIFSNPKNSLFWLKKETQSPVHFSLSAGTSGKLLAFRISSRGDTEQVTHLAELLVPHFKIRSLEETIFLNAYPMGVELPTHFHQMALPGRVDLLASSLYLAKQNFSHTVLIAQPHFLFAAIHLGEVPLELLENCSFVIGGGTAPPAFWTWLKRQLLQGPNDSTNLLNLENLPFNGANLYGLAETGLGVGIGIQNHSLPKPSSPLACPLILDGNRFLFELIDEELVVTVLDPNSTIPLVRYRTGDRFELGEFLPTNGSTGAQPIYRVGFHKGRLASLASGALSPLHSLQIENWFYENAEALRDLTGDFFFADETTLLLESKTTLSPLQKMEIASLLSESVLSDTLKKNQDAKIKIEFTTQLDRYPTGLRDLHRKPRRM